MANSSAATASRQTEQLLFLFSSNIRPLYEQDILDVLAAPQGLRYRFRYDGRYIGTTAKERWKELPGSDALVLFSLQQEAEYQQAVFIPVRTGRVASVRQEAHYYFVDFTLGPYVSLPAPPTHQHRPDRLDWAQAVRTFADQLEKNGIETPYRCSASLGPNILQQSGIIDTTETTPALFDRTTQYLSRTDSFKRARFFRFFTLTAEGVAGDPLPLDSALNTFHLTSGVTYTLSLFHSQPTDIRQAHRFLVHADRESLRVVGREWFEISSRYDIIEILIRALYPRNDAVRDSILIIEPAENVKGPALRLSFRIQPGDSMA